MRTRTTAGLKRRFVVLLVAMSAFASVAAAQTARPFTTGVDHAFLVDYQTGTVLFQKDADFPMPPASMAKLMTMAVVFGAIRAGEATLDDRFRVSENAWRKGGATSGGSTMFAAVGSEIRLEDLIRGVIVQSGNDAAIVIAEGLAGSEDAFAVRMNDEATRIGLADSTFANATGLPDPRQRVTARDLALLAAYIIREFPEFYAIYSEREFTWNGITQRNRNPLLGMNIGADGMKTGYTEESGYGLVASTVRDGRRLIAVINGADTEAERAAEARALLDWGYDSFRMVSLFHAGEILAEAPVFGGDAASIGLRIVEAIPVLLPVEGAGTVSARVVYSGPIPAPIEAGELVGRIEILVDDAVVAQRPLVADRGVGAGTMPQRALDALGNLFAGVR
ncbi:MAG: D-alanyl-D-alanine carboxypeptidase [Bauldia sp.]|nr:D-alanyl-D-alanine carboxypeptidase [Bauldia sp.]